jgi:hypothetical protein
MLQWLYTYVTKVCYQCFICVFGHMLQMCLSGCCIYFTHMLHVFYPDVAYVCKGFQVFSGVFFQVFQKHVASVCFRCFQLFFTNMLKVFYPNVEYVVMPTVDVRTGRALSQRVNLCCVFPTPDGDAKRIHRGFILVRAKEGPTSSGKRRVLYFFAPKCLYRGYKS